MNTLAGIGGLGTPELMVILAICVLLFGPSRLPGLARGVGEGIREFKKGMSGAPPLEESDASKKNTPDERDSAGVAKDS
ncbi:MAG: twin-arginine translocase TatA/TatE family subunit [Planctomycetes bacterium]|nr:twin-arginine translocase TatA/TatE family subunit [Planctomycetota bacterium]